MLHVRFAAGSSEGVCLTGLQVDVSGSGDDTTEIVQVVLWRDVDGDGIAASGDAGVGTGVFTVDDGWIYFDLSGEPEIPAGGVVHYLVVCDFAEGALSGSDFTMQIAVPTGVSCESAVTTNSFAADGSSVTGGTKTIASSGIGSLSVSMGGNSPASGTVGKPATDAPMLQFNLTASSMEAVSVTRLKFAGLGSGDESSGIVAKLFVDPDGDGLVSSGSTALGTATYTQDDGFIEFSGLNISVPAGGSVVLVVAYDVPESCQDGSYRLSLAMDADVTATGETTHAGINAMGAPLDGSPQVFTVLTGNEAVFFMGGCAGGSGAPSGWAGLLLLLAAGLALISLRSVPSRRS
jgi:hypothetical protein